MPEGCVPNRFLGSLEFDLAQSLKKSIVDS
jgi:hypothetical protein